jgi:cytochrome c
LVQASPRSGAVGGTIEVHLDSPTGQLIGETTQVVPKEVDFRRLLAVNPPSASAQAGNAQSQPQAPQVDFNARRRMMSTLATAVLQPVEGSHDLYFVFRNSGAASNQIIMQVLEIEFKNGSPKK